MNWTNPRTRKNSKRAIIFNRSDKDIKDTVISNLVPEDKRNILFTTRLSSDEFDADVSTDFKEAGEQRLDFIEEKVDKLEGIVKKLHPCNKSMTEMTGSSFFTLQAASSSLRKGKIHIPSIDSGFVNTPCLLIRTSRFLAPHLTPDNLDDTVPADASILEMNFDYLLENGAILNGSPVSIAELAGVSGSRATCLSTRLHSSYEMKPANAINGDDFVTVQNSSGSSKFDLKEIKKILERFKPDFVIGPFDKHQIPMSFKRVRKAVDRNLKYGLILESACESALNIPFISSISGADNVQEKLRNIKESSLKSGGLSFSDINKLPTVEERLSILKEVCSKVENESLLRVLRGSIEPADMEKYLPFVDIIDTSYVDDVTSKGYALQLCFDGTIYEKLNMWDEIFFDDFGPMSSSCTCLACKSYKRSYVHHLLKSHEMLAGVLLMTHNLHQYYRWLEFLKSKN